MKDYLKPCPFCGGRAEVRHVQGEYDGQKRKYLSYFVLCTNCLTSSYNYNNEKLAANAWNRRYYVD